MAKTLLEAPLTTRAARSNLPVGTHWRGIDAQVHLGYRKSKRAGEWLVRWRHLAGYRRADVGVADDNLRAGTLDFDAAVRRARKIVEETRLAAKAAADGPLLTVRLAVEDYLAARDARETKRAGRPVRSDASRRMGRHLLGQRARGKQPAVDPAPLAAVPLAALKERDLMKWRAGLPETIKAATRQRLVNDVKAALNAAYLANRDRLPPSLPGAIKHGLLAKSDEEAEPVARDNQILTDGQVARLLRAAREIDAEQKWDGDLFRVVVVLAATGSRFSQIARMRVGDCQIQEGRLLVPASRKGRGNKIGHVPVPVGRDVLDALVPIVTDRPADAPLFERWRHVQTGPATWRRVGRGPWLSSAEMVRPWHAIRQRAEMPGAIAYAFRHSSIVRGIRVNLPIRLVAALHDTSVQMIERHYGRYIADGLEDLARAAVVPLVPAEGGAVVVQMRGPK